jgi:predicted amidophosphoribosyltransferase
MKTLINCRACGREISSNATSCPHCGEPRPEAQPKPKQTATGLLAAIIIGLLAAWLLIKIIGG